MPSNASSPDDRGGVCILEIGLESDKLFKSVKLKIRNSSGSVVYKDKKSEFNQATFIVPKNASTAAGSTLLIKYQRSKFPIPPKRIEIEGSKLLHAYNYGKEWTESYGGIWVSIQLANRLEEETKAPASSADTNKQLNPTTDEIRKICPRFRILVLGKSGAGKSSLINKAFGVTDAHVSDEMPGEADIDKEILSKDNPSFVLHDSRGFEGGETETLEVVERFIRRRSNMREIESKLHAVWVCIEIPTTGGRLMETGVENFLKSGAEGHLGEVPIIVVFTKLDALVAAQKFTMAKENPAARKNEELLVKEATERANSKLETDCTSPLKEIVGKNIPHVTISATDALYRNTLTRLIEVTFKHVTDYISEAGILSGISQKVNPDVKILTSIEVGKRNYWKGLASETMPRINIGDILAVIHFDIVNVWDLDDKHNHLISLQFRELMLRTVEGVNDYSPSKAIIMGEKIVTAVGFIASLFAAPVAPITLPITLAVAVITWIYATNRQTRDNLRRMMTYLVSLTIVMQNLFWMQSILAMKLESSDGGASDRVSVPIKRQLIVQAWKLYLDATDRQDVLTQIDEYARGVNFVTQRADATVEEITRLLHSYTIKNEDAFKQQISVGGVDESWEGGGDIPWPLPAIKDGDTGRYGILTQSPIETISSLQP